MGFSPINKKSPDGTGKNKSHHRETVMVAVGFNVEVLRMKGKKNIPGSLLSLTVK
jgi:hypothetical protein